MENSTHYNSAYQPYSQVQAQAHVPSGPPGLSAHSQAHQHPTPPSLASGGGFTVQNNPQHVGSHATLPPLQVQNGTFPQYASVPYIPTGSTHATPSPAAPHAPASSAILSNGSGAFQQHLAQATSASAMLPPAFPTANPFGASPSIGYGDSPTASTTPPTTQAHGLPALRPMPSGATPTSAGGLPSLANATQIAGLGKQPSFLQNEEIPTHVVGSQGRRGILPSAPGRPNPPAQGSAQANKSMIPQKDADGKFPCPHCSKTYLHAKHLKRHLLRHTGDRPYMCHLCKDTFSRSDILKRHFQKCSLRRGNPTGANHLAHQRRNTTSGNRLSISQQDGPIGLAGLSEVAGQPAYGNGNGTLSNSPSMTDGISARSSRANSLITPGTISHRNSVANLAALGQTGSGPDQQLGTTAGYQQSMNAFATQGPPNGAQLSTSFPFAQPSLNGSIFNQSNQQAPQHQMSFLGHQSSRFGSSQNGDSPSHTLDGNVANLDWFNHNGQDGFMDGHATNVGSQGTSNMKTESEPRNDFDLHSNFNDSFLGSLMGPPHGFGLDSADRESLSLLHQDSDGPLRAKVTLLSQHCFPDGPHSSPADSAAELLAQCLEVEHVKHLMQHYTSYHRHWPLLHLPTFRVSEAQNNLVLAVLCIGAVYSPMFEVHQVRQLMDLVRSIVHRTTPLFKQSNGPTKPSCQIEELQALSMLQTMFTWHGTPAQRELGRADFHALVRLAKAIDTTHLSLDRHADARGGSQSLRGADPSDGAHWDWASWLEREKRIRIVYQVWIMEAAMVIFFNVTPQFQPLAIDLPLPCDDAAWDAATARECASALHLDNVESRDPEPDQKPSGAPQTQQATLSEALRLLLDPSLPVHTNATNIYAKFLLIHALILQIISHQQAVGRSAMASHGPQPSPETLQQDKKFLAQALEKWKTSWDTDLYHQYHSTPIRQRRFGFSRDAVHYYYLARVFLGSKQPLEFDAPADVRFVHVMSLLKRIKTMVVSDRETKGLADTIGSIGDIDDTYGLDTLTLDMKLLFKPYDPALGE